MPGARIHEPRAAVSGDDVAHLVEPPPAGSAEHLEQLVRTDLALEGAILIGGFPHEDGTNGEIDSGCETECRHDDPELTGLGQWLDQPGPLGKAEPAVVPGDALSQQPGKIGACQSLPFTIRQLDGMVVRQDLGDLAGDLFGGTPVGRKNEQGSVV